MIYHVIGTMSGSSLDGLDIVYAEFTDIAGKWSYEIHASDCIALTEEWTSIFTQINNLSARELTQLDTDFGKWMGLQINSFIESHQLLNKIHLICSHGHTAFHAPELGYSKQLGHGACLAVVTSLPVVNDLRQIDVSLQGQGAPIVPISEKLLFPQYQLFLNLGGICNLTSLVENKELAFDIAPCNRVLNYFAQKENLPFDKDGILASYGTVDKKILDSLNNLNYYELQAPKSLANEFGTDTIIPILENSGLNNADILATYTTHIALQIAKAIQSLGITDAQMLVTGGGAYNKYLISLIMSQLSTQRIDVIVPDKEIIDYKEALAMALIGVLRWREENNVLSEFSGAIRSSIGGCLWMV